MKIKLFIIITLLIVVSLSAGLINARTTQAQEDEDQQAYAGKADMAGQIQEILATQRIIMQKLDAIASELQVVKIRATLKG